MPFETHQQNGLVWLTAPVLSGVPHGFSTRQGGVSKPPCDTLNLAPNRGGDRPAVEENYRRFCGAIGVSDRRVVLAEQVHETTVRQVTEADAGKGLWKPKDYTADALVTDLADTPLVVFSADCGILLLYDPVSRCAGAIHAGWRGCAAGIVAKTVAELGRLYGAKPENLLAAVGPGIGRCCFETDGDVPEAMRSALGAEAEPYLEDRGRKWHVDLPGLNRQWLLHAGLLPEHIDLCGLCTFCHPELFWSYRKVGGARGAQCAMISLPPAADGPEAL